MRSKAYILQNFCIIDSMKQYNQGFPFLYNTFYQGGGKILPGGGGPPAEALATPLTIHGAINATLQVKLSFLIVLVEK
jgi:hypothetical protein